MAARGRVAAALTLLAVAWGVAFAAFAAVSLPPLGLLLAVQPLLVSLMMWRLLHARCASGSRPATISSRLIAWLYLPWSIIGAVTLAIGAIPSAVLLALAAAITPEPDPA